MTTHRAIQISQLFDTASLKAASLLRGVSNLQRIGNRKGAAYMLDSAEQWTRITHLCKRRLERDHKERAQLEAAIAGWRECATGFSGTEAYKASCERTAQALTLELQTGKPHCNCCLIPWSECPYVIRRNEHGA